MAGCAASIPQSGHFHQQPGCCRGDSPSKRGSLRRVSELRQLGRAVGTQGGLGGRRQRPAGVREPGVPRRLLLEAGGRAQLAQRGAEDVRLHRHGRCGNTGRSQLSRPPAAELLSPQRGNPEGPAPASSVPSAQLPLPAQPAAAAATLGRDGARGPWD